jgi:hypothetical protein
VDRRKWVYKNADGKISYRIYKHVKGEKRYKQKKKDENEQLQ